MKRERSRRRRLKRWVSWEVLDPSTQITNLPIDHKSSSTPDVVNGIFKKLHATGCFDDNVKSVFVILLDRLPLSGCDES